MYGNPQTSWRKALPDLERVSYHFLYREWPYPRFYYQTFTMGSRRERLKIHARSYQGDHRYFEGISVRLLNAVDGFVFWFEGERALFVIPSEWLRQVKGECTPVIKKGQWLCNVRTGRCELEIIGNGGRDISQFGVRIPK